MAGERHGDEVAVALGLSALSRVAMERCRFASAISLGRDALRRVGEQGIDKKETDWIHPSFDLAGALVVADQLSEAEKLLRADRRLREDLGSTWDLPLFTNTLAYAHLYSGRWDDAIAEGKTVLSLMDEGGARGSALWAYSLLAYVALYRDGIKASQRILEVAEREITAAGTVMGSDQILWCEALVAEALGDMDKASQLMERAWNLKLPFKVVTQSRMGPDAVRLACLTGRDRQARSAVQDVERMARESDVALYKGVALRCRGLLERDAKGLLTSVAVLRDSRRPLELALAAEDAGVALTRAGRLSDATPLLREAVDIYEQLGAVLFIVRGEAALRAAGVRRGRRGKRVRETKGWASLTRSEKDVVDLVVQGLTNREVGARLLSRDGQWKRICLMSSASWVSTPA